MTEITARTTARRMVKAASALLDAFTSEQRLKASSAIDEEDERRRWSYYPREFHGLPLKEMDGAQQKLIGNLLESSLSLAGHAKVATIMALENVLDRLENHSRDDRDPGRYYLSLFGAPGSESPWGWRFEGHHVSLHYTLAGEDILGFTPSFLGANPARVTHAGAVVSRPLAEEEDLARQLVTSLDPDQRGQAIICAVAPPDIVLSNAPRVPERALSGELLQADFPPAQRAALEAVADADRQALAFDREQPAGISGDDLSDDQRDLLFGLVRVYLDRLPDDAAAAAIAELGEDVVSGLHFAWAGELEPRLPHYYRIQGERFLAEYDNTQNNANHIHAAWRDPANDFGDLLLEHYLRDHITTR